MEHWLVVSNCNTTGLANSLSLLCPDLRVTAHHIHAFQRLLRRDEIDLSQFDRTFAHPEILKCDEAHRDNLGELTLVPSLYFAGYHPDACYVRAGDELLKSPIGDYHSAICLAAFLAGMKPIDAERLFNEKTYEAAGYFDVWHQDRATEFAKFAEHDVDLGELFVRWARHGPFMHTLNHPKIDCIFDTARLVLDRLAIERVEPPLKPHDNLCNGTGFPVYPEIAEHCGVAGSLLFKISGVYRLMPLGEFVRRCYRLYERAGRDRLKNELASWPRFRALRQVIG